MGQTFYQPKKPSLVCGLFKPPTNLNQIFDIIWLNFIFFHVGNILRVLLDHAFAQTLLCNNQGMRYEFGSAGAVCSIKESSGPQNQQVHIVLKASNLAGGDVPKICGFVHLLHPCIPCNRLVFYKIDSKFFNCLICTACMLSSLKNEALKIYQFISHLYLEKNPIKFRKEKKTHAQVFQISSLK